MGPADELRDWIIDQGLSALSEEAFVAGLAARLAPFLPLTRLSVNVPSLDPNLRGASFVWQRGGAMYTEWAPHGSEGEERMRRSPIQHILQLGLLEKTWCLADEAALEAFPLLGAIAAEGGRHYLVKIIGYPNETQIRGMAFGLATDDAAGFGAAHHGLIDAILPAIGLAVYRIELSRIAREMLRIYVGARTGDRILDGFVHRGEGEAIDAAILFADLKGFTALSERLSPPEIVALLGQRFDLLDRPIAENGGEILKFMGDGLLAVFPLKADPAETREACARALQAARDALAANTALNAEVAEPVALDIALHLGTVFYGNIGAARRLDFTVIGPAVNLASRLEELCDELGRHLVLSRPFAERCGAGAVPLGFFALKGIAEPQEVFGYESPF
ncbi:adenylate cyclase [Aureimonas endophytica]|uniref:Adenylate cyclase n=1 Tax=Aureimonas endophytica TaxID=2027858 RepID=A0A917E307_9HYPH|nr:adenylate/guanylate cyclase domain-containing protein [Aureimonas endophytica]GGE00095.1 adenylate cyclase [Aureimonas endophytica]